MNVFQEIQRVLPDFSYTIKYAPKYAKYFMQELLPVGVRGGIAIFYKNNFKNNDSGGFLTYKLKETPGVDFGALLTGNLQWVSFKGEKSEYLVTHIHGLYQRDTNKTDTPARRLQSQKIIEFLASKSGKKILCGDFNLLPDTESIAMLTHKYRNLINEYKITNTRSKFYDKPIRYADYLFVSKDITVNELKMLDVDISDHLPMYMDLT